MDVVCPLPLQTISEWIPYRWFRLWQILENVSDNHHDLWRARNLELPL